MAEVTRKHRNVTIYDDMAFPEYEYREFPMAVPVVDGVVQDSPYDEHRKAHPVVMVNSQAELDALLEESATLIPQDYEGSVSRVETEDDKRAALLIRADQLGVKVDKRWSLERIEKTINEAETVV